MFFIPILILLSCNKSPVEELDPLAQQRAELLEEYGLIELSVDGGEKMELFAAVGLYDSTVVAAPNQFLVIYAFSWNYYWLLNLKNDAPLHALSLAITNFKGAGQYDLNEDDNDTDYSALGYWTAYYDEAIRGFTEDESYASEDEGFIKIESITSDRVKGSFSSKVYEETNGTTKNISGSFDLPIDQ